MTSIDAHRPPVDDPGMRPEIQEDLGVYGARLETMEVRDRPGEWGRAREYVLPMRFLVEEGALRFYRNPPSRIGGLEVRLVPGPLVWHEYDGPGTRGGWASVVLEGREATLVPDAEEEVRP